MAIDDTTKSDVNSGRVDMGKLGGLRRFGIPLVGEIPWGTHLCQFYETREDLIGILVPYFTQGLKSNEFCMWVTSLPLEVEDAKRALREAVPDLDKYLEKGQIEILSYRDWYLLGGMFDSGRVLQGWVQKEKDALNRGFDGLRLTGNTFWVERNGWKSFTDYEAAVNDVIPLHRMIALCTYSLERCRGSDVVDVIRNHVGTLIKRGNEWCMVEDVEQRREAEEMYKATVETSKDGFWVTDSEGRFLSVNDAYCNLVGYSRDELLKMHVQDVEANETAEETLQHIGKIRLQGYDHFETRHRRKDGKIIDIEVSTNFVNNKGGRFFVFLHDVTARKQSEEAIRETQQRLSLALRSLGGATWDWNLLNGNQVWSREMYELHGLDPSDLVPLEKGMSMVHPEDRESVVRSIDESHRNQDELWSKEFRIISPKRGVLWVAATGRTIYDEMGKPIRMIGMNRDITRQKGIEQEIRSLAKFPSENPNAVIRIDREGAILYCNPAGKPLLMEWNYEDGGRAPDRIFQLVVRTLDSDRKIELEETYGEHTFSFLFVPFVKEGYVNVYGRDVTQRRLAEQALRDSQNDLNRAQAVAKTGSWRLNVQANELLWSDETHQIFGIPKGTPMTYETFLSSIHPDDRKYVDQKWQAALRGEPYDIEHRIVVDGEVKWVREKAELETDEHGSLLGGFGTVQDITERKKAEEILRETRDYLDNLLNYASAPIIVWDKDFKITRFNHAFEHLAGYKAEEVVGKDLSILFPADSREKSLTEIQHTLEGEYWESMEIPILRKDNKIRIVLWNSANIYAQHGSTLVATIAQGIDITERKKLEERLKTAERMAAIGETAAMVGHDLRNPLQAMVGFIGLAEEQLRTIRSASAKKQEIREQLKAITQQAQYMNKIVLDLQDYARPLAPELKGTDLTDLVKEVLSTLQIPETIRVSILMPHNFPKIKADPTLIRRALTNLFRNAVDAMPDGGKLTIKASQAHGEVSVKIKDTGTGIAEKNMDRLFKPLFTTKAKGQGFGLPVCKQIIEAHGGSITVESQLGKGSTFTLTIPHNKRSQKKNMHEI